MSSTTPILLDSRLIGRAHYAVRALLDRELSRTGTTFHQSMALNAAAAEGGTAETDRIVELLTSTLRIDGTTARDTVAELLATELLEPLEPLPERSPRVALTGTGRAEQARLAAVAAEFGPRVYGGIPAEDLAVAGRVLAEVIAQANAAYAETADRY
ncbi:MarR family transcriptional regulator [Streptomyces sp. NPDC002835]|jgi:DNA-binding MarR family transcriptional regulator